MKKLTFVAIVAFFLASCASAPEAPLASGSVSVKKLSKDAVSVTWSYENADAVEVGLVGDFQGWNLAGAIPFSKDAAGVWKISLDATPVSVFTYKLNVDGEWTEDPLAPATVDDGFGGANGVANVAEILKGK